MSGYGTSNKLKFLSNNKLNIKIDKNEIYY